MKSLVFFISFLICYLAVILLIALKLRHITVYPEKYDHPELEACADRLLLSKKHCRFFRSLGHQYSMPCLLFTLLLTALAFGAVYLMQKLLCAGSVLIFQSTAFCGAIAALFLNIVLGMGIIPLSVKTPFFAVVAREAFNLKKRRLIYKRAYKLLLFFFILTAPFMYLSANHYLCYNDEGIRSSLYWEITEQQIAYQDIACAKIYLSHDNSGKISAFHYDIARNDVKTVNINHTDGSFSQDTLTIHKKLKALDACVFEITPLNESDRLYISEKLSTKAAEAVNEIFKNSLSPVQ